MCFVGRFYNNQIIAFHQTVRGKSSIRWTRVHMQFYGAFWLDIDLLTISQTSTFSRWHLGGGNHIQNKNIEKKSQKAHGLHRSHDREFPLPKPHLVQVPRPWHT